MQVSVEVLEGLERRMTVQLPAKRIDAEVQRRLGDLARRANLDGFRPGKVPIKVVKKRYGSHLRAEVITDELQKAYGEALQQEDLRPAGAPVIDMDPPAEGEDCIFKATFEVYPEVEVKGVEEIEISKPEVDVTDGDVDRMLETLRSQRKIWTGVDRAAADGDRVQIDFVGKVDGEEFPGGKSEDFHLVLGAGTTIPGFDENLLGMSKGDEKTFEVTFPDDYGNEALAGKHAAFEVVVKEVAESALPEMDEDFAKSFGVEEGGMDTLKSQLRDNMSRELGQGVRARLKEQVMEGIMQGNEVAVPKALVDQEIRSLLRQSGATLPEEQEFPISEEMREAYGEEARRRVTLGLLVGEVIKANDMTADAERVRQHVESHAASYESPDEVRAWYRDNPRAMDGVRAMALEEQVVDWVLERAKVKEESSSFAKIMKPGWDEETGKE